MNRFFTFCTALFPGMGQMYYKYMKRGVSIMTMFFAVFGIGSILNLDIILMALPVIWAYSFFDTYNIAHFTQEQARENKDAFLFNVADLDWGKAKTAINGHKWLGVGVILLGVYLLYNNVIAYALRNIVIELMGYDWVGYVMDFLPSVVVAILLIVFGAHLVRGNKRQGGDDEIVEFKGEKK